MATTLNFTKQTNGFFESSWTSDGDRHILQINRDGSANAFRALASVDGMDAVEFFSVPSRSASDMVFAVDVPEGVQVTFSSESEVISAKLS